MLTIDEVKAWLNRAYRLEALIELDKQKIKDLEELSTTIGGFSTDERVQTSPNLNAKYERYIFDRADRIKLLQERINEREKILEEVDKLINSLDDNLEIEILSYRYLRFMSFREMEETAYISKTRCQRIHDEAIKKLSFRDNWDTLGH